MKTAYIPSQDPTATQHDGMNHFAVNNAVLGLLLVRIALKTTAHFFNPNGPYVLISKRLIVKTVPFVHLTEAAFMGLVAANTSIPVPAVYCSFVNDNRAFIVIERVRGKCLAGLWLILSNTDRGNVFLQLR